ncbi:hypothetical protein MGN01_46210 [Methylobacterium gnaphalii]|uniref:Uncharacterized protein n=1 Tax=Methylobacterium gnaphalii TaxID=1010610 RepID=A0A512JS39_9HYPH|nr:hypothetical protein MGN01_46210 [Methylobacterium gnaphalii]GLS48109.1 hypothetical protein GCM10007885_09530 [Methylobacterium gnaphalii]
MVEGPVRRQLVCFAEGIREKRTFDVRLELAESGLSALDFKPAKSRRLRPARDVPKQAYTERAGPKVPEAVVPAATKKLAYGFG